MYKDFDLWNKLKKEIQKFEILDLSPHSREIWWCTLGVNIGSEQDGSGQYFERPALILKKLSLTTFLILPLSTKQKLENFQYKVTLNNIEGYVLLDQIKVVDIRRFLRKMGYLDKINFENVIKKFKDMLYKSKDPSCEESISEAEATVV